TDEVPGGAEIRAQRPEAHLGDRGPTLDVVHTERMWKFLAYQMDGRGSSRGSVGSREAGGAVPGYWAARQDDLGLFWAGPSSACTSWGSRWRDRARSRMGACGRR